MVDTLLDFEYELITKLGWSLHDIDCTSIDSMFLFVRRISGGGAKKAYCDEVGWL